MSHPRRPCSAKGCKSRQGDPGVIMFRYPPDYLERGWMKMVNKPLRWKPKPSTKMCSLHFPPGSFSGMRLLPGANPIPNLHLFHNSSLVPNSSQASNSYPVPNSSLAPNPSLDPKPTLVPSSTLVHQPYSRPSSCRWPW